MSRFIAVTALLLGIYDTAHAGNFCQDKPAETAPREVRMRAQAVHQGVCNGSLASWWLDVEQPTEMERFAYVTACLAMRPNVEHDVANFMAWCADDVAAFDEAKGLATLKKLGIEHTRAGEPWKHVAEWKQKVGDAQWKPVLEAVAKAKAAWRASVDGDRELYTRAFALAMKADDGAKCTADATQLVSQYLAKQKPKTLDAVRDTLMTPVGFRVYWTMYECAGLEADGPETFALSYSPPKWEGGMASADELKIAPVRGPRTAGAVAADAVLKDSHDAKLSRLHVAFNGRPSREDSLEPMHVATRGKHYTAARGVIAGMKPDKDDKLVVTFKTETQVHDISSCKTTNKINRINPDGTVEYWQDCKVTGSEKVKVTPHPVRIAKTWATNLKAGKLISYFYEGTDMNSAPTDGTVSMIWTDAKRTAINGWAGLTW